MESKGVPRNWAQRKPQRRKSREEEELLAQRTTSCDPCSKNDHTKLNRSMKKHTKPSNKETMKRPSRPPSFPVSQRSLSFVGAKPSDDGTDITEERKRDSAKKISSKDDDRFSDEGSIGNLSSDQDTDLASRMLID